MPSAARRSMFGVVQLRYDDFHPGSLIPQSSTNTKTMCGAPAWLYLTGTSGGTKSVLVAHDTTPCFSFHTTFLSDRSPGSASRTWAAQYADRVTRRSYISSFIAGSRFTASVGSVFKSNKNELPPTRPRAARANASCSQSMATDGM